MRGLLLICLLALLPRAIGCPWCQGQASGKLAPTVTADEENCGGLFFGKAPDPSKVRRYFIAAESVVWDYLPLGADPMKGAVLPPHLAGKKVAVKYRYRQYTDETFNCPVLPDERLGIMGPVMRGVTGDFIVVTLLNRLPIPISLHPHGVRYDKDSEGANYLPERGKGASIAPNARFTYVWHLDEASAPASDDPSSKPWLYHSHVNGDSEINAGLVGFLVVTDRNRARPDGTPVDVDREMALLFQNYEEGVPDESAEYAAQGPDAVPNPLPWADLQEQREFAMRHAINGRIFGNLEKQDMILGERVRWYLFALGNEADVHTAHWHGMRLRNSAGKSCDVVELMPGSMTSADMVADNPGRWLIHCHVGEHMMEGMYGGFAIRTAHPARPLPPGFLGMPHGAPSVSWIEADSDFDPQAFRLRARCRVAASANLSVWTSRITVKLGDREVTMIPDRAGVGSGPDTGVKILNANAYGVVESDQLEIEILLAGRDWADAVFKAPGPGTPPLLPLRLMVGGSNHDALLPLVVEGNKALFRR